MSVLLKVAEVAERLRRDPATVRRMIRRGELAAFRVGGQLLVDEDAITAMLERARVEPTHTTRAPRVDRPPPAPTVPAAGGSFRSRRRKTAA